MARTLSAARARVRPGREGEYLELLGTRRQLAEQGGGHFWIFRSRTSPGMFLEFNESSTIGAACRAPDPSLAARLDAVAEYAPDADEVWEEIALGREPGKE